MSDGQKPLVTSICFTYSHTHTHSIPLSHTHTHMLVLHFLLPTPLFSCCSLLFLWGFAHTHTHSGISRWTAPATLLWPPFSWLLRWMRYSDGATLPLLLFLSISGSVTKQAMRTGAEGTQSPLYNVELEQYCILEGETASNFKCKYNVVRVKLTLTYHHLLLSLR